MNIAIAFRKYEEQKRKEWLQSRRNTIKAIVKYVVLTVCGIILFHAGSVLAYAERGYKALGGEMFLLLLPLFYYLVSTMYHDVKKMIKEIKEENKNEKA